MSELHQIDLSSSAKEALATLARGGNASLVIKSNVSPDITLNIADILSPSSANPQLISSPDQSKLQWIKPEVELRVMGASSTYSPYGSPSGDAYIYLILAFVIAALLGAKISWTLCRSFKKP